MNEIINRLTQLRSKMKEAGVSAYVVTTEDFHGSEYAGAYFRAREYMSGFTGSAGTLVVFADEAALFTDGRYFIQAEEELFGSTIKLMRSGEPGVPKIPEYLRDHMKDGEVLGYDGRTVSVELAEKFMAVFEQKKITIHDDLDLVGEIWTDRPSLSAEPVWGMPVLYAGESRSEKLTRIREKMHERKADILMVSALDEISWTLNLRGNDVACNPVFLSYLLIGENESFLYINDAILNEDLKAELAKDSVRLRPYDSIYKDLTKLPELFAFEWEDAHRQVTLLYDRRQTNAKLKNCVPKTILMKDQPSVIQMMKAVKNPTEIMHIKQAHMADGEAVTRFLYWIKQAVKTERLTELDAVKRLEDFRRKQPGYLEPSFDTIAAYGAHGAIVHYEPTEETNAELAPKGLLLVDSGGQYMDGTTDITRTIVLGDLTPEEKRAFTLVLAGHLELAVARFPHGTRGENLDPMAREPLWREGMDFRHGTGHGVGFVLNVHEGPNRIHYRLTDDRPLTAVLEEGMVTSDEPGYYEPGAFGIRHENLLLCKKGKKTEYGQFMEFEPLTWVPFDREGIVPELLTDREIFLLNDYHRMVYQKISPYLDGEIKEWLYEATAPIQIKR